MGGLSRKQWRRQGIDLVGRLVEETRKRKLEVFWHHRVSEVDLDPQGTGAAWKSGPDPLKRAHPDWVLKTWWRYGLWNIAIPQVRQLTIDSLREVAQRYDLDGVQIDFARHVPCLSPGRQWELRHHGTELMRMARQMLLEVARRRGRPILLAAKVPQNLEGCRVDGLDVEAWARQQLVDIFTLGSRSMDVDVAGYRRITAGRDIQLQPCFDDHHTTDGYRYPPIELFRGVFGNWWQQGADAVVTFNWSNAPPEWCRKAGAEPGPLSQQEAYQEVGSLRTLRLRDKMFAVERRGGYPWSEGFFNRNDTAPLPLRLAENRPAEKLMVRICDDLMAQAGQVRQLRLRCVLFGARDQEQLEVRWNGTPLRLAERDAAWKDPQISRPPHSLLPAVRGTIASVRRNACCGWISRSIRGCANWARIASRCGWPPLWPAPRQGKSPSKNWRSTCTTVRRVPLAWQRVSTEWEHTAADGSRPKKGSTKNGRNRMAPEFL